MGARAVRVREPQASEERTKWWWIIAERLQAGGALDLRDQDGRSVRMSRVGDEWVLQWGNEPAWRGNEYSIARLAVQVVDLDSLRSLLSA